MRVHVLGGKIYEISEASLKTLRDRVQGWSKVFESEHFGHSTASPGDYFAVETTDGELALVQLLTIAKNEACRPADHFEMHWFWAYDEPYPGGLVIIPKGEWHQVN